MLVLLVSPPHVPQKVANFLAKFSIVQPTLLLPFLKDFAVWTIIKTTKNIRKKSAKPTFFTVCGTNEEKREELAIQEILKYAFIAGKISK